MTETQYTVLIADDNQEIIDALITYFHQSEKKFRKHLIILQATSGSDVLRILDTQPVDALFIDHHFDTGISGDETISQIDDPFENKFVVLMSGWKEDEIEKVVIKNHMRLKKRFKFLRKPFEFVEFQDKFLEMYEFLEQRPYPFPIQYSYNAFLTSANHHARITAIKDFFETFIRYSVSILMADLYRVNALGQLSIKIDANQNLTYGAWVTWLNDIVEFVRRNPFKSFMPDLLYLLTEKDNFYIKLFFDFKILRDAELGHGYLQEDAAYEEKTKKYSTELQKLYSECVFMSGYILMLQERSEILDIDSDAIEYQVRPLMGSEIKPGIIRLSSSLKFVQNLVYLYSPTNDVLCLNPFVNYAICPRCLVNRIFFLDRIQPNQLTYNSICNHRVDDKKAKSIFDKQYGQLF